ncbi:nitroreductase family protein [Maledivibacter halophilus]|uniref:Nitroreductase n=1 Tax=Maledivibacter halophilus TaxID=36842 RepID=A0A1T5MC91_9FIRM|nr:nitroreductase family protein [Maledivibacter halophilus]SKC85703.1 Nitroreductase [Maledivibacter halophilus]
MGINKIIKERRSVREYKSKKVEENVINDLLNDFTNKKRLTDDIKINFGFIQDGKGLYEKLDGLVGYYGKLIKAPHYIYITSEVKDGYLENAGYIGEKLVLEATKLGLGTCWIEVSKNMDKVKEILSIEKDQEIIGLFTIGYPKKERKVGGVYDTEGKSLSPLTEFGYSNIDVKYTDAPISGRKSIEDITYLNNWGQKATVEELEDRGIAESFYYMRLAPSWGNRQPWKFIIRGEKIVLAVCKDEMVSEKIAKIEAGIAMLYFELMIHESGIPGKWVIRNCDNEYNIPENYFIAGCYKI